MYISAIITCIIYICLISLISLSYGQDCPCDKKQLCEQISGFPNTEVFIFSLRAENAPDYDWSRVTTIVEFGYNNASVMCLAHSFGARAITNANIAVTSLTNETARSEWVEQKLQFVKQNFLDGVNVDFESAILMNDTKARDGLTSLMKELTERFKNESKNYMVSIDYAWSPDCVDSRCFDYKAIADVVDLAFVMAYDERSQIRGDCIAWANSAFNETVSGIGKYLDLDVKREKLVLGVPWYGYRYPCINFTQGGVCFIKPVPFRGVPCSDAAGSQRNYGDIEENLLPYSISGLQWNSQAQSPYFTMKDTSTGEMTQFWFDDPKSLSIKYNYAKQMGLRGVGMWNADAIDYKNKNQVNAMWGLLPSKQPSVSVDVY